MGVEGGLFKGEVAKLFGHNRNRFAKALKNAHDGKPSQLTIEDGKCDAEQGEIGPNGEVTKSPPPTITKP